MSHLFLNRELSLLAFNERVLNLAEQASYPLLERLKFACIFSSNMDEFFEIRVAGLKAHIQAHAHQQHPPVVGADGLTPTQVYERVSARAHGLVVRQYQLLNEVLLPQLTDQGVFLHLSHAWNDTIREWAQAYFRQEVLPILTPIGLDPSHPFPRVLNKSLNFAIELEGEDAYKRNTRIAIVQAPRVLPRLIRVPRAISGYPHGLITLTSIMQGFVGELFPAMKVTGCYQFRVTRNSDLFVDEEETTDLRDSLRGELSQRQFGAAVRLEVSESTSEAMTERLMAEFNLQPLDCYRVNGPVNLVRLMQMVDFVDRPDLKFPCFTPSLPQVFHDASVDQPDLLFKALDQHDVLLHHPYDSFNAVLHFLETATTDPNVIAIKQTIYRAGNDSTLMDNLLKAARNGKEVTVVLELLARFDEETNLHWAAKLEEAGAHVVFGIVGHKIHAKMALVVRRETDTNGTQILKRYAHVSTGNYHTKTSGFYTDFGLITANDAICNDIHTLFQQLTGLGGLNPLQALWQSPFNLHSQLLAGIEQEIHHAKAGHKAHIMAKMNSLVEPHIIQALYRASQAGVTIDLIVRGVCTLRPGVKGLSDTIQVRSILGRFLEHHRIFYFYHHGKEQVYISSADWMDRNFFRRIEIAIPITSHKTKKRVIQEGLMIPLTTKHAWQMNGDGDYQRLRPRTGQLSSQDKLLQKLCHDAD
jgi:polyphosphate kinase